MCDDPYPTKQEVRRIVAGTTLPRIKSCEFIKPVSVVQTEYDFSYTSLYIRPCHIEVNGSTTELLIRYEAKLPRRFISPNMGSGGRT